MTRTTLSIHDWFVINDVIENHVSGDTRGVKCLDNLSDEQMRTLLMTWTKQIMDTYKGEYTYPRPDVIMRGIIEHRIWGVLS